MNLEQRPHTQIYIYIYKNMYIYMQCRSGRPLLTDFFLHINEFNVHAILFTHIPSVKHGLLDNSPFSSFIFPFKPPEKSGCPIHFPIFSHQFFHQFFINFPICFLYVSHPFSDISLYIFPWFSQPKKKPPLLG